MLQESEKFHLCQQRSDVIEQFERSEATGKSWIHLFPGGYFWSFLSLPPNTTS